MEAVRRSNHLENYCSGHRTIDLVMTVNEPPHSAWFSATAYLEPEAAAYGIQRFCIAVEVGLRNDIAAYPCLFVIDPSSLRELQKMDSSWEELITQGIQATFFGSQQFADFLRQRAFLLKTDACFVGGSTSKSAPW